MSGPIALSDFSYDLPPELVAQSPVSPRDASRLLVMGQDAPSHHRFFQLPLFLRSGDVLVVNETRVVPARLRFRRSTGGLAELLLFEPLDGGWSEARRWRALGRPLRGLRVGSREVVGDDVQVRVVERCADNSLIIEGSHPLYPVMLSHGAVPLPPYIARPQGPTEADRSSYQTLFARSEGAVAAPTASLHFTQDVLAHLARRGVEVVRVTLHVGPGTFLPVREEDAADVRQHRMHGEHYEVPEATQRSVEAARARGGRVVAVGTTVVRALESWAVTGAPVGNTRLFIYPGFEFRVVDGLVTNFHLPGSTLLMLVSAFVGRERMMAAYAEAVRRRYRFFSYGDAMLLSRGGA